MEQYRKNLGKVSVSAEGLWDKTKNFDKLSIVYDEITKHAFLSKQGVPAGIDLHDNRYWMPLNVSGYSDSNIIIFTDKDENQIIKSYTLEDAIKSIASVGRKPGCIISFYNNNINREGLTGRWEIWQFNGLNVYDWENIDNWINVYYNYNKFLGWFANEDFLKKTCPFPEIGCYAYVGELLNEAVMYRCDNKYIWINTGELVTTRRSELTNNPKLNKLLLELYIDSDSYPTGKTWEDISKVVISKGSNVSNEYVNSLYVYFGETYITIFVDSFSTLEDAISNVIGIKGSKNKAYIDFSTLSSKDGLYIYDAHFNICPILESAPMIYTHVKSQELKADIEQNKANIDEIQEKLSTILEKIQILERAVS